MLRLISKKITSRIGELMKNLNELTFFEEPWLAWLDCSGNSLAEVDMKNGYTGVIFYKLIIRRG